MTTVVRIENVSKLYRLGTVGTGTIAHDLNRWWHAIRGKEDPYARVGQVNDRTKGSRNEARETSEPSSDSSPLAPRPSRPLGPDYVWALRDINLEVQQGEILGIIGRNGAGKSTLLKLLSRVTAPTTGSIKTKGRIASLLEVGTGFHPDLTGRENIYMNGAILGMRRHEITRQLDQIVEFSGCAKYLDTPVKRYSSGMTVRLGFAVAAHLECEILIVDEVLAVGDSEFQGKCQRKMSALGRQGRTILFVTHNLASVQHMCTAAALFTNGMLQTLGDVPMAIEAYLRDGKRKSDNLHLAERHPPFVPAITSAHLFTPSVGPVQVFSLGADIGISMDFELPGGNTISKPVMGIVIRDRYGNDIGGINTRITNHPYNYSHSISKGEFQCILKTPALVQGDYLIDLWLGDGETNIDCLEEVLQLRIEPTDIYGTGKLPLTHVGPMLLNPNWQLRSVSP